MDPPDRTTEPEVTARPGGPLAAVPEVSMTLRNWYSWRYAPELLPIPRHGETRRLCETVLKRLDEFAGHEPRILEINRGFVQQFIRWLLDRKLAAATVGKYIGHLMAVYNYAVEEGLAERLPRIRRPRTPKKHIRSWRVEDLSAMLRAAARVPGQVGPIPAWRFWVALILVIYDTGLRITAAMSLRWDDYDPAQRAMFIRAEVQKQYADQYLGVSDDAASALEAIRGNWGLVFPWPYDPPQRSGRRPWKTLTVHFRQRILAPAGVQDVKGKVFHRGRATHATQLKRGGGNPTENLGHSSPQVTERYIDVDELGVSRQCDRLKRPEMPRRDPQRRLFD